MEVLDDLIPCQHHILGRRQVLQELAPPATSSLAEGCNSGTAKAQKKLQVGVDFFGGGTPVLAVLKETEKQTNTMLGGSNLEKDTPIWPKRSMDIHQFSFRRLNGNLQTAGLARVH